MSLLVERYFRPKMCAGTFYGFCKFSRISAMGSVSAEREAIQQYIRILYMVMDYTMQECVYIYTCYRMPVFVEFKVCQMQKQNVNRTT